MVTLSFAVLSPPFGGSGFVHPVAFRLHRRRDRSKRGGCRVELAILSVLENCSVPRISASAFASKAAFRRIPLAGEVYRQI